MTFQKHSQLFPFEPGVRSSRAVDSILIDPFAIDYFLSSLFSKLVENWDDRICAGTDDGSPIGMISLTHILDLGNILLFFVFPFSHFSSYNLKIHIKKA